MERNYTEAVREGYFDMIDSDLAEIWRELAHRKEAIRKGYWMRFYTEVASKYRCSCRFAIMRILFEKATGLPYYRIDENTLQEGFSVNGIGNFPDITISHAQNMSSTELSQYEQLLLQRVQDHNPAHLREASVLVRKALALAKSGAKCALSRKELLSLGHLVNFSLDDMQFILLRVLGDNEVGFEYSSSSDVIDMYGFICGSTLDAVNELKLWYSKKTNRLKKISYEDKPIYCTQDIANSLEESFKEMPVDEFKSWLVDHAPTLDIKSKTARKVYLNLANYICYLSLGYNPCPKDVKLSADFYGDIEHIAGSREYATSVPENFFTNAKPDAQKCKRFAAKLIYENAEYASGFSGHATSSELMYHGPCLEGDKITARGETNRNSKQRIIDILMDAVAPKKSDLLYLLWFAANSHWLGSPRSLDEKAVFLDDFLSAASRLLEAALLPVFYPPNILETTMLLGIVCASNDSRDDSDNDGLTPAQVYESICSEFTNKGLTKKPKNAKKKDPAFREAVAEWVYTYMDDNPGKSMRASQEACANYYTVNLDCKISYHSVRNYCLEYPRK